MHLGMHLNWSTLESILSSFSLAWAIILVFNELASSVFIPLSSSVSCYTIKSCYVT